MAVERLCSCVRFLADQERGVEPQPVAVPLLGPLAHAWLEQRTHKICAIRLETAYGMVSNSVKPKRSNAYGNAEPSFGAKALLKV